MLQDYFLLVHRVKGIGLSVEEFWELDSWTTAVLLNFEHQIIEKEKESFDEQEENNRYNEFHDDNSPELNELVSNLMSED